MTDTKRRPTLLAILDGWGNGQDYPGNAILLANTPNMDHFRQTEPTQQLLCSGEHVGLPDGQMGNSEVGHLNIGAGFIVYQWITRLDRAIADRSFHANPAFKAVFDRVKANGSTLHLMGLIGEGGVHAHTRHLLALLDAAQEQGVEKILVHCLTDGRDTSPTSGIEFVKPIEERLASMPQARIATIIGRYYGMDRDKRWERVRKAWDAIVNAEGEARANVHEAFKTSYADDVTDEFIVPAVILDADGHRHQLGEKDEYIFWNFRSDRGRELTDALVSPDFSGFVRGDYQPTHHPMTTMTQYDVTLPVTVAFPPQDVEFPLARAVSEAGKTQYHSAETEKYPHVTFFINGGREELFPGEDRYMCASPKVATYDLQPEMSAYCVRDGVIDAIKSGKYDVIIVNFANGDMVGHTGVIPAVVKAIETVDECIGQIVEVLKEYGGAGIITADHGNAEEEIDFETGGPMTAHTTNPVPVILVTADDHPRAKATLRPDGILSALAPTILDLAGVPIPETMTQPSLIVDGK